MSNSAPLPRPGIRVDLRHHELSGAAFRREPALTADALLRSAVSDDSTYRLPVELRAELLSALGADGRAAYRQLAGRDGAFCATVVVPDVPDGPTWTAECTDALAEADPALLAQALDEAYGRDLSPRWLNILDDPQSWFRSLALGLRRTAPVIDAVWRHARPRLDVEEARMSLAASTPEGLRAFVNSVSSDLAMTGRELWTPWLRDMPMGTAGGVVVAPQVSPPKAHLVLDSADNIRAAYSVPIVTPRRSAASSANEQHLVVLLGPARAQLLTTLTHGKTMGQLAGELPYAASTLTHHAQRLVLAGLATSTQHGKEVILERTPAGHALIELFSR